MSLYLEEGNQSDIVLDTSSMNELIDNTNLSNNFFNILNKKGNKAVIPYAAFSELSSNRDIIKKFSKIYQDNVNLRVSERTIETVRREINNPIKFILYIDKDTDLLKIAEKHYENNKQHNIEGKNAWKQANQINKKQFLEDHNITPEEGNKFILEILRSNQFLIDQYDWIWDILSARYKINLPIKQIVSDKNRYKYINLLYYLMVLNIWRSALGSNTELSTNRGDLFDMEIASLSVYSSCFISEDKKLIELLKKIKNNSNILGFENKYEIYYTIKSFIDLINNKT